MAGHRPWSVLRDALAERVGAERLAEAAARAAAEDRSREFRAYITVLGIDDEEDVLRLHRLLDRDFAALGPVLDGGAPTIRGGTGRLDVIVATEAPSPAHAARELVDAVCTALAGAGLGELYPSAVELEPVDESRSEQRVATPGR